ncbi:hypothetical protein [Acinetobacter gerneri]|uniref:Uncharacterized protein n=1 Tax=Acinetobacter gerneri DSM 14967 = CIP 107464 = MTCC 9824 TaxID=1120926 RepID=N8Y5L5_9GAMM|nr:hypothetical protein [Acinetobacter gerneri]ENV31971.1 hypothetical protein F960_03879 [Acinetobacter gerneri DSM 14967 = CIP 107464 = MTCC 9824]
MFNLPRVTSSFSLRGDDNFISVKDFLLLYENFVFFSYQGNHGVGYCKELTLSDDPLLVIYSVELEQKFRSLKLSNFDFIKSKSSDDLRIFFEFA